MAIEQHPLPQDISSYRFRLIGDMTIKQFASLGISIVVGLVVYSLPLPFFFKYPLSFFFIVLGVSMAFVPVQGRSLDVWILAFLRSIYSPTQYTWKKTEESTAEMNIAPQNHSAPPVVSTARIEITKTPVTTLSQPVIPQNTQSTISTPVEQPAPTTEPKVEPQTVLPIPSTTISTTPVPETKLEELPKPEEKPQTVSQPSQIEITTPTPVSNPVISQPVSTPVSAETQLPIPYTPTTPNTLVGLTLTPEGKILDGVLVEIQINGLTSRATKSNKLGQFMFARPLENGTYQILAEKDNFTFTPYSLELSGQIVRPLKIQAEK